MIRTKAAVRRVAALKLCLTDIGKQSIPRLIILAMRVTEPQKEFRRGVASLQ
jgi:hypothetical protein